jgi:ribosomal protein S18 acetylase RimI-like enzyme
MEFRAPTMDDADAIVAMLCDCDVVDFGAPDYDLDALLDEWEQIDVERDAFYSEHAYGLLLRTDVRAWVRPERRGEPLMAPLLDRIEARAREKGYEYVERQVPRTDPDDRALLESRNWVFERSYADLRLPDEAVPALPTGAVRPYDEARDQAIVQELIERCFADGAGRVEPLDALINRAADTSLWFVAEDGGEVVGAIRSELRPTGFITGYVREVAVDERHRRRGIGGALIGAAARELVARGAVLIRLHVRSSNPEALRLYRRLGFEGDWQVDELRLTL